MNRKRGLLVKSSSVRRIVVILLSLIFIIAIGLLTKLYGGPGQNWVNHSLGGVFYEIFFCLVITLFFPAAPPLKIAASVFLGTSIVEFLQLYHPSWLEFWRGYWLGRTLLGTTFSVWDFPHYLLGCLLGCLWIYGLDCYFNSR